MASLGGFGSTATYAPKYSTISQSNSPARSSSGGALGPGVGWGSQTPTTTAQKQNQQTTSNVINNTQTQNSQRSVTGSERSVAQRNDRAVTTGTQRDTGTIVTDTMDPITRAAYNQLVATLQGGGTATQRQANANLAAAATNATNLAGTYTADAARQQAQQSMGLYTQQLQESIMPNINAAMEAAGMSGDSMNALLAQDAMVRVSRQAADAELQAILGYGQLQQGQQQISMAASAQMQADPVAQQLIAALGVGKGSLTTETRNLLTESQQVTESTGNTTTDTTRNELEVLNNVINSQQTQTGTVSGTESATEFSRLQEAQAAESEAQATQDARLGQVEYLTALDEFLGKSGATSLSTDARFRRGSMMVEPTKGPDMARLLGLL